MQNSSIFFEVEEMVRNTKKEVVFLLESSNRTAIINDEYMEFVYLRSEMHCSISPVDGIIQHRRVHPTPIYRSQPEDWERCAKEFAD